MRQKSAAIWCSISPPATQRKTGASILRLIDLINGDQPANAVLAAAGDIDIEGLTADSRQVRPGYLFAALPGAKADGRAFIADAIGRGARAVLA
ncbi:MAG: hypothetical protein KKB63_10790, partial [Alphaproteobacteria bacterium]|nr:hypothetical protein [Alphaproteobacteria bacterium]